MKKSEAPQDNIAMYDGGKKALYALGDAGNFEVTQSSGWSVEELATLQAVDEFKRLECEAYEGFVAHAISPIGVWMYRKRMSLATLSQCTGFWQWTIKRHLSPTIFKRLSDQKIARYCQALDITPDELYHPKEPQ